jgi:hypothetical protein
LRSSAGPPWAEVLASGCVTALAEGAVKRRRSAATAGGQVLPLDAGGQDEQDPAQGLRSDTRGHPRPVSTMTRGSNGSAGDRSSSDRIHGRDRRLPLPTINERSSSPSHDQPPLWEPVTKRLRPKDVTSGVAHPVSIAFRSRRPVHSPCDALLYHLGSVYSLDGPAWLPPTLRRRGHASSRARL